VPPHGRDYEKYFVGICNCAWHPSVARNLALVRNVGRQTVALATYLSLEKNSKTTRDRPLSNALEPALFCLRLQEPIPPARGGIKGWNFRDFPNCGN
jgi:hypothetical protein